MTQNDIFEMCKRYWIDLWEWYLILSVIYTCGNEVHNNCINYWKWC